jgi:hypothetical protein
MKHTHYISFTILLLFFSCKKKEENTPPFIQFISISPINVTQFVDPVTIKIHYEDSEGDLGHPNPDSLTMYIHDSRLSNADSLHIPPLTPEMNLSIKGDIDIDIGSPFLLGNGGSEYIKYTIKVKDNYGLWSNEVVTDEIEISP